MEFDKIKVSLFISTLVLLVVTIGMVVFGIKQGEQIRQLKSELKSVQTELANKQSEQDTNQSESEKIIKEFYKTVYNYEKSQKEISMTTVKELATDNVYQELQNEINVNNSYSPQQNTIQKSSVNENEIKILLLPTDPNDEKDVIVEIRAGVGGDEAGLFAGDLLRMYLRYAERRGWKTEFISVNEQGIGGYKEVIFSIKGKGAYSRLKYESGVHRVQRVPDTESSGRIHTSSATVAVLPEADDIDIEINPNDVKVD